MTFEVDPTCNKARRLTDGRLRMFSERKEAKFEKVCAHTQDEIDGFCLLFGRGLTVGLRMPFPSVKSDVVRQPGDGEYLAVIGHDSIKSCPKYSVKLTALSIVRSMKRLTFCSIRRGLKHLKGKYSYSSSYLIYFYYN